MVWSEDTTFDDSVCWWDVWPSKSNFEWLQHHYLSLARVYFCFGECMSLVHFFSPSTSFSYLYIFFRHCKIIYIYNVFFDPCICSLIYMYFVLCKKGHCWCWKGSCGDPGQTICGCIISFERKFDPKEIWTQVCPEARETICLPLCGTRWGKHSAFSIFSCIFVKKKKKYSTNW